MKKEDHITFAIILIIVFLIVVFMFANSRTSKEEPKEFVIQENSEIAEIVEDEEVIIKTPETGRKEVVRIENNKFTPKELTIKKGTTVVWVNYDKSRAHKLFHISVKREFFSPRLHPGDFFNHTFDTAGEYVYTDTMFRYMRGKIIVEESPSITGGAVALLPGEKASSLFTMAITAFVFSLCFIIHKRLGL